MVKVLLSNVLRLAGAMQIADKVRYAIERMRNKRKNLLFRKEYPGVALPPDYLLYESFHLSYQSYYLDGLQTAQEIVEKIQKYNPLHQARMLDWGCGPGRIIRHMPALLGDACTYYATDYNQKSIDWCTENLPGIAFCCNKLEASLMYPDAHFDAIYGISIFTHLSENMHHAWLSELLRVLKPGGILLITTQGKHFRAKLTQKERDDFEAGKLVVRGKTKEGHRTYSAFHPSTFMNTFLSGTQVLEHEEPDVQNLQWIPQDIWIVKKKNE